MSHHKPILVLGGTGHYGRRIVASLLNKGVPVRVLTRKVEQAKFLGNQVELVAGDITSSESVAEALAGARALVISVSAFSPSLIRKLHAIERDAVLSVLAQAQAAQVLRVVYISVYNIRFDLVGDLKLESAHIKAEVEAALARSGLNWTVLGAPPSMEIFFAMIRGSTLTVPGGGPPALPTISPVDVGEIAAQAALRDDLGGKRFRLAGPEAISFPDAARRIGQVRGQAIGFRAIPLIFPRIAAAILRPLATFNDTLYFASHMLKYVELLNRFPAEDMAEAHQLLRATFDYTPTTLEAETQRRMDLHAPSSEIGIT